MKYVGFPDWLSRPIDQIPIEDTLRITSPEFEQGGELPESATAYGGDHSPELHVDPVPEGTKTFAVTLEETDSKKHVSYWVIWNLPPYPVIAGDVPKGIFVDETQVMQGMAVGEHCYKGPKVSHLFPRKKEHYLFTVYALDTVLDIYVDTMREDLLRWMNGHVLGKGTIRATFTPKEHEKKNSDHIEE